MSFDAGLSFCNSGRRGDERAGRNEHAAWRKGGDAGDERIRAAGRFLLALLIAVFFGKGNIRLLPQAPWYAWLGGVLAPVITLTVMWAIGSLTPTVAISAILLSQLTVAALIDVFGWLGAEKMPFSWEKWVGVALMVGGVILMKIKT